jgi:hypothetical protein
LIGRGGGESENFVFCPEAGTSGRTSRIEREDIEKL